MTTAIQQLITAEEFIKLPQPSDGSRQELVRGVLLTMLPPGGLHGACCSRLGRRLGSFVEANQLGEVFSNDTGFVTERSPDSVRGPDVAFWSRERLPEIPEGYIDLPPDLAVEVISPEDLFSRIQRKIVEYMTRGVRLLWVIDPLDRGVGIYRPEQSVPRILSENETLTGEDVLEGFRCLVRDLFP
jgi:Uma2 family endonuclease